MLIVQYPLSDSFDAEDDLAFRQELETIAAERLAAANLGSCDGGDAGSGALNVFCTVTRANARAACAAIAAGLEEAGIEGFVIAMVDDEDDDATPEVLWPPDFEGTFGVL